MKKQTLSSLVFQQNVLFVLLCTFVVVIIWVGGTIYFSYSKSTITTTDAGLIAPLNPRIDGTLFQQIGTRKTWSSTELEQFPISIKTTEGTKTTLSPTPRQSESPTASSSAKTVLFTEPSQP
jgi:hypothetical protein